MESLLHIAQTASREAGEAIMNMYADVDFLNQLKIDVI